MKSRRSLTCLAGMLILLTGCMTATQETASREVIVEKTVQEAPQPVKSLPGPSPIVENAYETLVVPEGYYDNGIVTFSGESSEWEIAAGIHDPSVKGVEVLVEWRQVEPVEGTYDWSLIDDAIRMWGSVGKYVTIRLVSANQNTHITPGWLFDTYKVRRIAAGLTTDFERRESWYELGSAGERTKEEGFVLDRLTSLRPSGQGLLLSTDVGRLSAGRRYGFQFDYSVIEDGRITLQVSSKKAGTSGSKSYTLDGKRGDSGLESWTVELEPYDDYVFSLISESGSIVIDNLSIHEITSSYRGNVGFPNYFDPIFKEKWENLITRMAERYDSNPHVDTIVVTGYGRWGEINLEGDDVGERVDQWLWVKWSEKSYLDHVQWAAELFKRLFPNKTLRMVAGGFSISSMTDQEMLYWRVMNMCNSLGIQMKINGLQEGFGIWKETMFSYGAHRFKNDPTSGIVLETAGQIYRNITGVDGIPTGHPISLLNRGLIDGVDILYLYGPDILSRNINKHFHYMAEQMGAELFTQLYNLHGLYNTANETWGPAPIGYTDIWNGIYHTKWTQTTSPHRYEVTYDIIDGHHVIQTTDSSRSGVIEYDIDGRLRYSGMYGAMFHLTYYDEGTDTLTIEADDYNLGRVVLKEIRKQDTKSWVTSSIPITSLLDSRRNRGEDDHVIIVVDDQGDGTESIHRVELDFIPAAEWQTESRKDIAHTDQYELVTYGQSSELLIPLDPGTATSLAFIDIPVWASENLSEYRLALASVYGTINGDEQLITEKEYFWARDKDRIPLPIATGRPYEALRVVLHTVRGKMGWYLDSEGKKDYGLRAYSTESSPWGTAGSSEQFELLLPTSSLRYQEGMDQEDLSLERKGQDGSWQQVATGLSAAEGMIDLEPQTPGIYRLLGAEIAELVPQHLQRLIPARPALRNRGTRSLIELSIDSTSMTDLVRIDGGLKITGQEPSVHSDISLEAYRNDHLEFTLANRTGVSLARFFWKRAADDSFSYERSILIPIVPNDGTLRDYRYNIGEHPLWEGAIVEVRLEPVSGTVERGFLDLERWAIDRPQLLYAWEFSSQADRFFQHDRTDGISYEDGKLLTSSLYASLDSMPQSPNIWADRGQRIEISLKNSTESLWMDFTWKSELRDELNATHEFRQSYTELDITAEDEGYKTYVIDCDSLSQWEGLITNIGLTFYNEQEEQIAIDSIRIYGE